ncbi:ATP-binding protein [Bradyrhizobium sp. LMG 9283]|uniref:ATP-binding protein n=1 Tax=Bradyrhizobium sp. LMG 9283 TaxID=592064 RepID=UPI00388FF1E1
MTIKGVTDEDSKAVLAENLTPSDTIKTPERLFGREKNLRTIDRALSSPGRQIFIYGDRGVGKTSLALTSAYLHSATRSPPIHVTWGRTSGFAQVMQAIGNALIPVEDRVEKPGGGGGFNLTLPGLGGVGVTRHKLLEDHLRGQQQAISNAVFATLSASIAQDHELQGWLGRGAYRRGSRGTISGRRQDIVRTLPKWSNDRSEALRVENSARYMGL